MPDLHDMMDDIDDAVDDVEDATGQDRSLKDKAQDAYDRARDTKDKIQSGKEKVDDARERLGKLKDKIGGGKKGAEEGAKEGAKAAGKGAAKEGAKEAGKEAAKEAAKEAGKQIAKEGAKQGAKVAAETAAQAANVAPGVGVAIGAAIEAADQLDKAAEKVTGVKPSKMLPIGGLACMLAPVLLMLALAVGWEMMNPKSAVAQPSPGGGTMSKVPLYKQWDPAYQSLDFACGGTHLAGSGCNVTSLAMVISFWTGKDVLPTETGKIAVEKGWRGGSGCSDGGAPCNGICWEAYHEMPQIYGLQGKHVTWDQAKQYLKKGWPIIQNHTAGYFTNHGHYIVVTGINSDGTFAINDPDGKHRTSATESDITASMVNNYLISK